MALTTQTNERRDPTGDSGRTNPTPPNMRCRADHGRCGETIVLAPAGMIKPDYGPKHLYPRLFEPIIQAMLGEAKRHLAFQRQQQPDADYTAAERALEVCEKFFLEGNYEQAYYGLNAVKNLATKARAEQAVRIANSLDRDFGNGHDTASKLALIAARGAFLKRNFVGVIMSSEVVIRKLSPIRDEARKGALEESKAVPVEIKLDLPDNAAATPTDEARRMIEEGEAHIAALRHRHGRGKDEQKQEETEGNRPHAKKHSKRRQSAAA